MLKPYLPTSILYAVIFAFISVSGTAAPSEAADLEHSASVDGTQYTTVSPIFTGAQGNYSYLRFFNWDTGPHTVSVTVVGLPTGHVYGSVTEAIPGEASPQFSASDLLAAAGASTLVGGDTGVTLYLQKAAGAYAPSFQHVIFNVTTRFFENLSICVTSRYSASQGYLPNVHTSSLSDYPSIVYLQNPASTTQQISIAVYEAGTGQIRGVVTYGVEANNTLALPMSKIESDVHWSPTTSQLHANLFISDQLVSVGGLMTAHLVYNQALGASFNLTQFCDIK